jgi:lipooligosaccharide transport system permease protein
MSTLFAIFDWRSIAVLRRNALVYFRNWKTAFFPPAMEPVIFFVAFGLGLGTYVGSLAYDGTDVPYATWVAPGLLAYTAFSTPFFEGLYASYVRMFYQKTWDGILATQVEIHHIVWGEILWCGARGAMNTAIVAAVLGVFQILGLVDLHWGFLFLMPLVAFVVGWTFGAFALIFTAIVPGIDHMNYPVFLSGIPLGLISNTYFPLEPESPWLSALLYANPVYELAETARGLLVAGRFDEHALYLAATTVVFLVVCATAAQRLTKKRVLGD